MEPTSPPGVQSEKLVVLSEFKDRIFLEERFVDPWKLVPDGSKYQLAIQTVGRRQQLRQLISMDCLHAIVTNKSRKVDAGGAQELDISNIKGRRLRDLLTRTYVRTNGGQRKDDRTIFRLIEGKQVLLAIQLFREGRKELVEQRHTLRQLRLSIFHGLSRRIELAVNLLQGGSKRLNCFQAFLETADLLELFMKIRSSLKRDLKRSRLTQRHHQVLLFDLKACKGLASLARCAEELGELLREQEVFVNPVTWGGGDSADLLRTFAQAQIEFHHFGRRWIDVKTWTTLLSLARTRTATIQHGGLSKAMARYKLQFVGKAHRADIDALNTLRLFFAILERQRTLEGCISKMKNL